MQANPAARKNRSAFWGPVLLFVAAAVIYTFHRAAPTSAQELKPAAQRQAMADFTLPDLNGKPWTLSEHRGKVVLINIWATWCPPCRHETPDLVKLANAYRDKGLDVLGVSVDKDDLAAVRKFVAENNIPYPVVNPPEDAPLVQGVDAIPVTLLLDRQGRIATRMVGAASEDAFKQAVDALLAEK